MQAIGQFKIVIMNYRPISYNSPLEPHRPTIVLPKNVMEFRFSCTV